MSVLPMVAVLKGGKDCFSIDVEGVIGLTLILLT